MDTFDAEDGPVLLGPWPSRGEVEAILDAAIEAAGHQRVGRFDLGFTAIARLVEQDGAWWLEPGRELAWQLPARLEGFGAMPAHPEENEWAPAIGAELFQVRSTGEGGFLVVAKLADYRPDTPPDVTDLLADALRGAAGLGDQGAEMVLHEARSVFSCRVVERTFEALEGLDRATWQVERQGDEVRIQTATGSLPSWRALTASEWQEIGTALGLS